MLLLECFEVEYTKVEVEVEVVGAVCVQRWRRKGGREEMCVCVCVCEREREEKRVSVS